MDLPENPVAVWCLRPDIRRKNDGKRLHDLATRLGYQLPARALIVRPETADWRTPIIAAVHAMAAEAVFVPDRRHLNNQPHTITGYADVITFHPFETLQRRPLSEASLERIFNALKGMR